MPLFYVYYFNYNGEPQAIYAISEDIARRTFKKLFKTEAGILIRRDHD